jgi:hypothetical protein
MLAFIKNDSSFASLLEVKAFEFLLVRKRKNSFYNYGLVVQLVRIPACHAGGRGFESRPDRTSLQI